MLGLKKGFRSRRSQGPRPATISAFIASTTSGQPMGRQLSPFSWSALRKGIYVNGAGWQSRQQTFSRHGVPPFAAACLEPLSGRSC